MTWGEADGEIMMGRGWGAGPVKPRHRPAHRRRGRHAKGCWLTAFVMLAAFPWLLAAGEPTWRKRGCGTSLLAWLLVVLVPLILW